MKCEEQPSNDYFHNANMSEFLIDLWQERIMTCPDIKSKPHTTK